ncbi:MAG: patatin-like phospholipase family protein [Phycisphaerae bacterium]|nr:patatin-like phospholipase family protein [Phycisphaerae bacterium]
MNNRFQILALDGGGIKGLFSAAVLAFLEEDLHVNISDHFDLITGTSTGGIIALGLALGMKARELVEFYVCKGPEIFSPSCLSSVKHLIKSKYGSAPLESALQECFKNKRLADSQKRLVIPSYNIGDDSVYLFKTPHHERLRRDYKVPVWKVARATCAAPTYFPAFAGVDNVRLIDGGVWANNPSIVGITEAVSLLDVPLEHIYLLNLGTTNEVKAYPSQLDTAGCLKWCRAAVNIIMRGQSVGAYTQAQHLIGRDRVERLDPKVPDGLFALDKLSTEALLGKAAHESRHFCPRFKELFGGHVAPKYIPSYQYMGEETC